MSVAIIDYGSGNLRSAAKALARAAGESDLSAAIIVTNEPEEVLRAERIVLPGVGAFADCLRGLDALPGMREALHEAVQGRGRPFLGICVGMQLLAERGFEHGCHAGLGWIGGDVVPLAPSDPALKVPHMGWNELVPSHSHPVLAHPVLAGIAAGMHAYFVHSYRFAPAEPADVLAETDHGGRIAAMIGRDNLVGAQFHPEKSQAVGLRLLANFLAWRP